MAKCKNFDCRQETHFGHQYCDQFCAFYFQRDRSYLENVLADITPWRDASWGIARWSVEKYLYYLTSLRMKVFFGSTK